MALSTDVTQMVDNLINVIISQFLVLVLQIGTQVVCQENFTFFSMNITSIRILPACAVG